MGVRQVDRRRQRQEYAAHCKVAPRFRGGRTSPSFGGDNLGIESIRQGCLLHKGPSSARLGFENRVISVPLQNEISQRPSPLVRGTLSRIYDELDLATAER
jgi:hypothetical protein